MISPADLDLLRIVQAAGRYHASGFEERYRLHMLIKRGLVKQLWDDGTYFLLPAGSDAILAADASESEAQRLQQAQSILHDQSKQQQILDCAQHIKDVKQQRRHDFYVAAFSNAFSLLVKDACGVLHSLIELIKSLFP